MRSFQIFVIAASVVAPLLLAPHIVVAQSDLPKNVQADLLRNEIGVALNGCNKRPPTGCDYNAGLAAITKLKRLGEPFPDPLLFTEAVAANRVGDHVRAFTSLTEFLKRIPPTSKQYEPALALYPVYQKAAEDEGTWKAALKEGSLRAIDDYQKKFPDGRHRADVSTARRSALTSAYNVARERKSSEGYRLFIQAFGSSEFSTETMVRDARDRLGQCVSRVESRSTRVSTEISSSRFISRGNAWSRNYDQLVKQCDQMGPVARFTPGPRDATMTRNFDFEYVIHGTCTYNGSENVSVETCP